MPDLFRSRQSPPLSDSALVRPLPAASRHILRGGSQVMLSAGTALGLTISDIACRSAQRASRAALWLGPDEQLLLASESEGPEVARLLATALARMPHSLVDISHRQIALELSGQHAPAALSVGCPLDLQITEFPIGMCTRTLLGKADIVLWRTGPETFHVEVWRSFAQYVSRFLAAAARELAC
jgi:sarcosine oxidase subunit gamma